MAHVSYTSSPAPLVVRRIHAPQYSSVSDCLNAIYRCGNIPLPATMRSIDVHVLRLDVIVPQPSRA